MEEKEIPDKEDYTKLSKEEIKSKIEKFEQEILYSTPYDNWGAGLNCSVNSCTGGSIEEIQDRIEKLENKILHSNISKECW